MRSFSQERTTEIGTTISFGSFVGGVWSHLKKKAFMLCLVAFGDVRVAYFVLKGRQDILRNGNVKIYILIEAKAHQPDIAIFAK